MNRVTKFLLPIFFSFVAHAQTMNSEDDFPINIVCQDPQTENTVISLGLDIKNNRAKLNYRSGDGGEGVNVLVHDVLGIYSTSSVSLKTDSTGRFFGVRTYTVAASFREVLRVTHFADITLELTENFSNSKITPANLTYDSGIEEIDGRNPQSIGFKNSQVLCQISGL